jgi:hypothetical protein
MNYRMQLFFTLLPIFLFINFFMGLIFPQPYKQVLGKKANRLTIAIVNLSGFFLSIALFGYTTPAAKLNYKTAQDEINKQQKEIIVINGTDKADAQKELDTIMDSAAKAGMVKSYEFSDRASVVYIDKNWYGRTVMEKKDFIAKVGSLKKIIRGYQHHEVRDAYSDEKVAELVSYSGEIKIYK